ncbi:MAG: DUF4124 domain-containing protein [Arenicellales bacterium]|nr:DUF4124 domain-containing protein [Arenicellales bacterium]
MYRLFILIFCVVASSSFAGEIYKYVDENGNVSYSETPPLNDENVQSLEPASEASDEEISAARERQQKLQTFIDEVQAEREQREAAKERTYWGPWPNNTSSNLPPLAGQ